jgi:hypothetical protein
VSTLITLSVGTVTEAARGALRDAVGALGDAPASWSADDPRALERWEEEGGPLAPPATQSPTDGDRFRLGPARGGPYARPSARDAAYAALGAYARALRQDGLRLPAALATLGAAVDDAAAAEAAGLLPPALLAAVQCDAAQCCRAAFAAA